MYKGLMIAALVGLGAAPFLPADAEARAPSWKSKTGKVTVCSRYGSDCYTAPVIQTRLGPKLVLRGGTTIHCVGDCRDTLREKTVDFWETQAQNRD